MDPAAGPAGNTKQQKEAHVAHKLVIVESPAKARTIGGYLGAGYVVESSIGHIRDLPNNAADTPAKIKDKPWGRLAVDVENGFEPYYVVPRDKKSHISKLKSLLKDADELFLATDEDREGEAIAWHLLDELKPKNIPVHRMVFHEITKPAIQAAVENPRQINEDLVEAQEARRILDRLYGYEVSPVLWKKVMSGLSAGRVQSVATRLVVDRERERMRVPGRVVLGPRGHLRRRQQARAADVPRQAALGRRHPGGPRLRLRPRRPAQGRLEGRPPRPVPRRGAWPRRCRTSTYDVRSVESKPYRRSPYAPFRTTTLQQEASRKLGFSASVTMSVAQRLYENGFITYMRTDSTTLSDAAVGAARSQVRELYGAEYLPDAPRVYASKVKNAQEAHEAIRPAGDSFRTPAQTGLKGDQFRLYELIWMRTVASQMTDAVGQSVTIRVGGAAVDGRGRRVLRERSRHHLPRLPQGLRRGHRRRRGGQGRPGDPAARPRARATRSRAASVSASGHETKPPARYTEATLIKELEDREIGRPSTYASIIGTILNRGYVYKKGTALVPAWLAFSVIRLLEEHFPRQVSYEFTARMEDILDEIAAGRKDRNTELGGVLLRLRRGRGPQDAGQRARRDRRARAGDLPDRGRGLRRPPARGPLRPLPGGPGRRRHARRHAAPTCPTTCPPDELTMEKAKELLANPAGEEIELGAAPGDRPAGGGEERPLRPLRHRAAARGRPEARRSAKPRTGSLFKSMSLDTITLDDAVKLLSLPRVVGVAARTVRRSPRRTAATGRT